MRHLLVPLDGSGFGETALALAAETAVRKGFALDIVTVYAPTANPDFSLPMSPEIDTWFRTRAQEYLDSMAEQVRHRFNIEVRTTLLQGGAASTIAAHALADPPELIVMCTHARSGASRLFLGVSLTGCSVSCTAHSSWSTPRRRRPKWSFRRPPGCWSRWMAHRWRSRSWTKWNGCSLRASPRSTSCGLSTPSRHFRLALRCRCPRWSPS